MSLDIEKLLCRATEGIAKEYFHLPVAGLPDTIYRERVYCYELYHQMRLQWSTDWSYLLNGEADKESHPIIEGAPKPDFIIHSPGDMRGNLLVMEVKPVTLRHVEEDLLKLCRFRRYEYQRMIYLIFGPKNEGLNQIDKLVSKAAAKNPNDIRLDFVELWLHEAPKIPAYRRDWPK